MSATVFLPAVPILDPSVVEVDVDGLEDDEKAIRYWGKARRQPNGEWHCLAVVAGCLCKVEITLTAVTDGR